MEGATAGKGGREAVAQAIRAHNVGISSSNVVMLLYNICLSSSYVAL
jgi:hypothetical protein